MTLSAYEQAAELVKDARYIAVLIPEESTYEHIAVGSVLQSVIEQSGRFATVNCVPSDETDAWLCDIVPERARIQNLEILKKHSIEVQDGTVENGNTIMSELNKSAFVSLIDEGYSVDCVIACDICDTSEFMHRMPSEHIATEIPTITLSANAAHERYGHANIIDITQSGPMTIAVSLLRAAFPDDIWTPESADRAYFGLMSETKEWRHPHITSRAFDTGGFLLDAGARIGVVNEKMYQTADIETLIRWADILDAVEIREDGTAVCVLRTPAPFIDEKATRIERIRLHALLSDFIRNTHRALENGTITTAQRSVIMWNDKSEKRGTILIWTPNEQKMRDIADMYDMRAHPVLLFTCETPPPEKEHLLIQYFTNILK